jgi:hypothetical protein
MCMSRVFVHDPIDVISLCLSFILKWRLLAGKKARELMERLLDVGYLKVKEFKTSKVKLSAVELI